MVKQKSKEKIERWSYTGGTKHHLKSIKLKAYAKGTMFDHNQTPFNWIDLLFVAFASALVALVLRSYL